MLKTNQSQPQKSSELERNIMFVTTIYDTFEALEETLGKLKLERPLFLVYLAKQSFAEEVFKYAKQNEDEQIYLSDKPRNAPHPVLQ